MNTHSASPCDPLETLRNLVTGHIETWEGLRDNPSINFTSRELDVIAALKRIKILDTLPSAKAERMIADIEKLDFPQSFEGHIHLRERAGREADLAGETNPTLYAMMYLYENPTS